MKRALLVFNPQATSVSPAVRDVIAHALSSAMKVEIAETKRRHHATHLAEGAAHEGFDQIVALTGDGTLNEIANGLIGTGVPVIPLPGGGTNVFARTMGLPKDPIEATSAVLQRIEAGLEARPITLGRVNGRAFLVNVGFGFDAAVVRAVERHFRIKRKVGDPLFAYQAVRTFLFAYPRKDPPIRVMAGDQTITGAFQAIVCNSNPYTFWGARPFQVCPLADQERGLDVTAFTSFRTLTVLRAVARAFGSGGHTKMRSVKVMHDLWSMTIESDRPVQYQVDGDVAGEGTHFELEALPKALNVLA